jgi:hypothetical protein
MPSIQRVIFFRRGGERSNKRPELCISTHGEEGCWLDWAFLWTLAGIPMVELAGLDKREAGQKLLDFLKEKAKNDLSFGRTALHPT